MREVRVVVVANHDLAPAMVAMHLLQQLAELPMDARVSLRAPLNGRPGPLETLTEILCKDLKIPVDWHVPQSGKGGLGTIERDQRMVSMADLVLAYFDPKHTMDPDTGTGRVVKMAMDSDKRVEAYQPIEEAVMQIGSTV